MFKPSFSCAVLVSFLGLCFLHPEICSSQLIDQISSDHVVMRMPQARESLGRDTIETIEQFYAFVNRATNQNLPRKILINVDWDQKSSGCNQRDLSITVGMNRPDKTVDLRGLFLHKAEREVARLGLLQLSGWAQRQDTEFLFEGMIEILVHEFSHSSRSLESAWAYCQILDQMQMLSFNTQRAWTSFSGGGRTHRNAAPGVTFLTTYRELQGRDRPVKLFEALKKSSLNASLSSTFKAPISELENTWLKKVREHRSVTEITIFEEEAPQLLQAEIIPDSDRQEYEIRLLFTDRNGDLFSDGVFVRDDRTQRMLEARESFDQDREYEVVRIPVAADCAPGQYTFEITAIDEAGNLRCWTRSYSVGNH